METIGEAVSENNDNESDDTVSIKGKLSPFSNTDYIEYNDEKDKKEICYPLHIS